MSKLTNTVELDDDQIYLIAQILENRLDTLADILKRPDIFEAEQLRDLQLEQRDINNIIRELRYYTTSTTR